jgi:hypothetical protein
MISFSVKIHASEEQILKTHSGNEALKGKPCDTPRPPSGFDVLSATRTTSPESLDRDFRDDADGDLSSNSNAI